MISAALVKELRDKVGVSMMDCKRALVETNGDIEKAITELRKQGAAKAEKKAERSAKEGFIGSYVHSNGKIGIMVELNCETDFVAKNPGFREFAKDVAMHIAAANPSYLTREDVPEDIISREKEIHLAQIKNKPQDIAEKIIIGKMNKFYSGSCLMEQFFIKDDKLTIKELLTNKVNELGENLLIKRFSRIDIGQ